MQLLVSPEVIDVQERGTIKATGWLGLAAASLVGVAEFALHYDAAGRYGQSYEFLRDVPQWHMNFGHFVAVLCFPIYFAGYWHLYLRLRPAAKSWRLAFLLTGVYSLSLGQVWLGSRVYLILLLQSPELLERASFYNEALLSFMRLAMFLSSAVFAWLVATGRSSFPPWLATLNPILLVEITEELLRHPRQRCHESDCRDGL
ncbi:MAG: DUF6796 family protein [Planctomycetota bacterium]